MKREDFYYESRDNNTKLHAVRWEPEGIEPVCILQLVHGMAEHVDRYENFAEYLCGKGFVVTAEDHLGHGKSISNDGTPGYFCKQDPATVVVRDVHRLKKLTEEKYPGLPYFLLGHSMGSFIARNYLFRYGKGIDGAIIMGTGNQAPIMVIGLKIMAGLGCLAGHAKRPSKFINSVAFGAYLKRIDNHRTEFDWLTKVDDVVDKYIKDPLCGFLFPCNGFKTMGELLFRLTKDVNLSKMPVTLPVLITSGSEDPVGNYGEGPSEVFKEFKAQGMQHVSLKLYEGDRHEILNETDKETVYEDIYTWISEQISLQKAP